MIKYTPAYQLTLKGFSHPFDNELDPENRWVKLASLIPWDELAGVYARNLRDDRGRETVDIRMVIGAMIVKHTMGLSDRDTVQQIAENIYIQYFCGLKAFQTARPFDPSLLVEIRKRMGAEVFEAFNELVIEKAEKLKPARKRIMGKGKEKGKENEKDSCGQDGSAGVSASSEKEGAGQKPVPEPEKNKGTLKLDATIADQMIKYPTDLTLLGDARQQAEGIIDQIWRGSGAKAKPRDYRRVARKAYLNVAKKKRKTKKEIRKAIKQQLQYLRRDIRLIHHLLDGYEGKSFPLDVRAQRLLWVIQLVYDQQREMLTTGVRSHPMRIVNLHQPWVRPMVRGKDKANVEFGAKLGVSEVDGFARINHISWEAYNESTDLKAQVEAFGSTYGCWPKVLLADRIYLTRENRAFLKERNIQIVGKPLGRPPKEQLAAWKKHKNKKLAAQRNHVEGKFGQGKNAYGLRRIRARRQDTSESWIAAIFFVMNLTKLMQLVGKGIFWLLSEIRQAWNRLLALALDSSRPPGPFTTQKTHRVG